MAPAKPKASKPKTARKTVSKTTQPRPVAPTSGTGDAAEIVANLQDLGDWRGETLLHLRQLIHAADPDVVEQIKWRKPSNAMKGVPTWSHDGLLCTGETYKDKVKITFAHGAALDDPKGLFNADDTGATRRAIDVRQGDRVDDKAFKQLIRAAISFNQE